MNSLSRLLLYAAVTVGFAMHATAAVWWLVPSYWIFSDQSQTTAKAALNAPALRVVESIELAIAPPEEDPRPAATVAPLGPVMTEAPVSLLPPPPVVNQNPPRVTHGVRTKKRARRIRTYAVPSVPRADGPFYGRDFAGFD